MRYTLDEWREEGERRFGGDIDNWAFDCPKCGRTSAVREFKEAGAGPDDAYSTCIGRHNGKGLDGYGCGEGSKPEHGCNWAAFGLFGTLGKGDKVVNEAGEEVEVFRFAEARNWTA